MNTKVKIFEIALALVILVGIASVPFTTSNQLASVGYIFGPNNTNETVLKAQIKLKELGVYDGNLSGLFGLRTFFSIRTFQESKNLNVNGILDIPTQRALFSSVDYLQIPYTTEGNTFLYDWVRYFWDIPYERVELRGELSLVNEAFNYQNLSTQLRLSSIGGLEYSVINISSVGLEEFVGKNVIVSGLVVSDGNNPETEILVINHLESDGSFPISVGYTENGNIELVEWVENTYGENHSLSALIGTLSTGSKAQYMPGGNTTKLVITTEEGISYSVENISNNDLSMLEGRKVMIRGMILSNTNNQGLKTIVLNYMLPI